MSITVTKIFYTIDELSEDAKKAAFDRWFEARIEWDQQFYYDEANKSLKEFLKCFNLELIEWNGKHAEVRDVNKHEKYRTEPLLYFKNARAYAAFENRVLKQNREEWKRATRRRGTRTGYVLPGAVKPCPFTGVVYDEIIIEDFFTALSKGDTIHEAVCYVAGCLDRAVEQEVYGVTFQDFVDSEEGVYYNEDGEQM